MASDLIFAKQRLINSTKALDVAMHSMRRAKEAMEHVASNMPKDESTIFNEKSIEPNAVVLKGKVFEFKNAYDANAFYDLHVSEKGSYKTQLIHIIKEG